MLLVIPLGGLAHTKLASLKLSDRVGPSSKLSIFIVTQETGVVFLCWKLRPRGGKKHSWKVATPGWGQRMGMPPVRARCPGCGLKTQESEESPGLHGNTCQCTETTSCSPKLPPDPQFHLFLEVPLSCPGDRVFILSFGLHSSLRISLCR